MFQRYRLSGRIPNHQLLPVTALGDMKVKRFLNNVLQAELEPIRNRRKELQKDIPAIYEILKKGSEKAEAVAAQTLKEVKDAMKINYFDDKALIEAQAERFSK